MPKKGLSKQPGVFPCLMSDNDYGPQFEMRLAHACANLYRLAAEITQGREHVEKNFKTVHELVVGVYQSVPLHEPEGYISPILKGAQGLARFFHSKNFQLLEHLDELCEIVNKALNHQHVNLYSMERRRLKAVRALFSDDISSHAYTKIETCFPHHLAVWSTAEDAAARIRSELECMPYIFGGYTVIGLDAERGLTVQTVAFTSFITSDLLDLFNFLTDEGAISVVQSSGTVSKAKDLGSFVPFPLLRKPSQRDKEFVSFTGIALDGGL